MSQPRSDPRPQAPGAKRSNQEVPVDWRVRSQELEDALREREPFYRLAAAELSYSEPMPYIRNAVDVVFDALAKRLSLGLPVEEGEQG